MMKKKDTSNHPVLEVFLAEGRAVTRNGKATNLFVVFELYDPPKVMTPKKAQKCPSYLSLDRGELACTKKSSAKLWNKHPQWDDTFELGPVVSMHSVFRVAVYHYRGVLHESNIRFGGEMSGYLADLGVSDTEIRGWFPMDTSGATGEEEATGELKLGIRVRDAHLLDVVPQVIEA